MLYFFKVSAMPSIHILLGRLPLLAAFSSVCHCPWFWLIGLHSLNIMKKKNYHLPSDIMFTHGLIAIIPPLCSLFIYNINKDLHMMVSSRTVLIHSLVTFFFPVFKFRKHFLFLFVLQILPLVNSLVTTEKIWESVSSFIFIQISLLFMRGSVSLC